MKQQLVSLKNNLIFMVRRFLKKCQGNRNLPAPMFILIPVIIISIALSLPVIYLLIRVVNTDIAVIDLLLRKQTLTALLNTLKLSIAVTSSSIAIAVPIAWLTVRSDLPGKKIFSVLTMVPLVIPSLVGAFTFISAFGQGGIIHNILAGFNINYIPNIYGFSGAWILLTLLCYPYILLSVRGALIGMDQSQIEAARTMGQNSWQTFWKVTLPKLRPAIAAGGLLVALYTLSDFAAVSLLQYDTFTRIIYIEYQTSFNRIYAAVLALVLIFLTIIIVSIEMKSRRKVNYHSIGSGTKRKLMTVYLGKWKWAGLAFCTLIVFLALVLPVSVISYWLIRGIGQGEQFILRPQAAINSFYVSAVTAIIAVICALPVAILSTRYNNRFSGILEKIAYIGYALPGIVVALALVFFGANYAGFLYQTLPLLLFAYVILFLPQALGSLRSSLLQLSPSIENAALTMGYSPFKILHSIIIPIINPGILSGAALVFLTTMKELPATLLLSPVGFRTLTTEIWNATIEAFYARAAGPSLLLVIISAFSLAILFKHEKDC